MPLGAEGCEACFNRVDSGSDCAVADLAVEAVVKTAVTLGVVANVRSTEKVMEVAVVWAGMEGSS